MGGPGSGPQGGKGASKGGKGKSLKQKWVAGKQYAKGSARDMWHKLDRKK